MALTANKRKQLVDHLVGNCDCETPAPFNADQREMLDGMTDEQLELINNGLTNNADDDDEEDDEEEDSATTDTTGGREGGGGSTVPKPEHAQDPDAQREALKGNITEEQWMAMAPAGVRNMIANYQRREAAEKQELIKAITANENNSFTADYLKTKDVEELSAIAKLAQAQQPTGNQGGPFNGQRFTDWGGNAPTRFTTNCGDGGSGTKEEPLPIANMAWGDGGEDSES